MFPSGTTRLKMDLYLKVPINLFMEKGYRKHESVLISCKCGCGEMIQSWDYIHCRPRNYKQGHGIKPFPKGNKLGAMRKGETHPSWKGGRYITSKGYIKIYEPDHPRADSHGHVFEHISVMTKYLGRDLKEGEEIHHIDKNKQNNSIENLMLFKSHSEHMKFDNPMRGESS